jgi:hypothetical protein
MRKSRVNKEMVKSEKLLSDLFVSGFQARHQGEDMIHEGLADKGPGLHNDVTRTEVTSACRCGRNGRTVDTVLETQ